MDPIDDSVIPSPTGGGIRVLPSIISGDAPKSLRVVPSILASEPDQPELKPLRVVPSIVPTESAPEELKPLRVVPRVQVDLRGQVIDDRTVGEKLPSIADQQATMGAPRPQSFLDRMAAAAREVVAPIVGQTAPQAARAAKAQEQLLPENRGGLTDKQVSDLSYDEKGNIKADRLKVPITSSTGRGIDELQGIGYGLAQWGTDVLGQNSPALDAAAKANREQIAANPPLVLGSDQVRGPGDAVTYAIEKLGENLPMSAPPMGSGWLSGAIAKRLAAGGIEKAVAEKVAARVAAGQVEKKIAVELADRATERALASLTEKATARGAEAASIGMELGSMHADNVEEGNRGVGTALLEIPHAALAGYIESVGEKMALGRLKEGAGDLRKLVKNGDLKAFAIAGIKTLGAGAFEQFVTEAPTELVQTVIEQSSKAVPNAAQKENFFSNWLEQMGSPEALNDYKESAIAGGISGAGMGIATGAPRFIKTIAAGIQAQREKNSGFGPIAQPQGVITFGDRQTSQNVIQAPVVAQPVANTVDTQAPLDTTATSSPVDQFLAEQRKATGTADTVDLRIAPGTRADSISPVDRFMLGSQRQARALPDTTDLTPPSDTTSTASPVDQFVAGQSPYRVDVGQVGPRLPSQKVRRAALEAGLTLEQPQPAETPTPAQSSEEPATPAAPTPPLNRYTIKDGKLEVTNEAQLRAERTSKLEPLPPVIDEFLQAVRTRLKTLGRGSNPEIESQLASAAPKALEILSYRINREIEAGSPDGAVTPLIDQWDKLSKWYEPRKPAPAPVAQPAPATPSVETPRPARKKKTGGITPNLETSEPTPTAAIPAPAPTPVPTPSLVAKPEPTPLPAPKPVREKIDQRRAEASDASVARAERPQLPVGKYESEAMNYLGESGNENFAHAYSKYLTDHELFIQDQIDGVPDLGQEKQAFITNEILNNIGRYISEHREAAFEGEGTDTKLKSGAGGFSLKTAVRQAISAYKRSGGKDVLNPNTTVNISSETPDGARPVAEVVSDPNAVAPGAGAVTGEEVGDFKKVRRLIMEKVGVTKDGVVLDQAGLEGVDFIIDDFILKSNRSPGADKRLLSAPVKEWLTENHLDAIATLQDLVTNADDPGEFLRSLLGSRLLIGTGSGITESQATTAVNDMLGGLPDNVTIVSDPNLVTPDGHPIAGMATPEGRIILNVANLSGVMDAKITLLHEAIHLVWDHPEVQALTRALAASESGSLEGYDSESTPEELAVRAMTDQWQSDQSRTIWQRLVDTIWTRVKQLLGMELTQPQMRQIVIAQAMKSLANSARDTRGVTRYSVRLTHAFRRQQDVIDALGAPGLSTAQQAGVKQVAQAIGSLIPGHVKTNLQAWNTVVVNPNSPPLDQAIQRAQIRAARMLRRLSDVSDLAIAPLMIGNVDVTVKDITANAQLEIAGWIAGFEQRIGLQMEKARARLDTAKAEAARINTVSLAADTAKAAAAAIIDGAQQSIDAEARLAPSLNAQEKAAVDASKKALGAIRLYGPAAVGPALQTIASVKPIGMDAVLFLRTEAFAASPWPSFGGTMPMTQAVFDFLAGPKPRLANHTATIDRIAQIQQDKVDARDTVARVAAMMQALGATTKTRGTIGQFAKTYRKFMNDHAAGMEEVRQHNAEMRRATDDLNALTLAHEQAENVKNDPGFQTQWTSAVEHQDARAKTINGQAITDWTSKDGDWMIRNPLTMEEVPLRYSSDRDVINKTSDDAAKLIQDIDTWMAGGPDRPKPNNPPVEATYALLKKKLQDVWVASASMMQLIGNVEPIMLSRDFAVQLPRRFVFTATGLTPMTYATGRVLRGVSTLAGEVVGRAQIYETLGGVAGKEMMQYMTRADHMYNGVRLAEDNPRYGAVAMQKKLYEQAQKHGLAAGLNHGQAIARYEYNVTNFILGKAQSLTGRHAQVGDYTLNGLQITQGDIDAARQQHEFSMAITRSVNRASGGASAFAPILTETEGYFRRSIDYGMKMQRKPSTWGKKFGVAWELAQAKDGAAVGPGSTQNRIDVLADQEHFMNAVNGMTATTNPTYQLSDKTQQKALQNRAAMGTNAYLFNNLDQFLDWMATERTSLINGAAGTAVTDPVAERLNAERFLIQDLDRSVKLFMDSKSSGAESESRVMGVGKPQVDAVSGRSSFTQERGSQIAPDSFYDYTLGSDISRVMFNASAMRYYQKMEIDALHAVIAAMKREQGRLMAEHQAWMAAHPVGVQFFTDLEYKRNAQQEVISGKRLATLRSLDQVLAHLVSMERGMQGAMKWSDVEDGAILRTVAKFETTTSMMKLGQPTVQFTNLLGASLIGPVLVAYARANGMAAIIGSTLAAMRMTWNVGKNIYRSAVTAALGNGPMSRLLANHKPVFLGLAGHFTAAMAKRQADIDFLNSIGVPKPPSFKEVVGRFIFQNTSLLKTSGHVTDRGGSLIEAIFSIGLSPFSAFKSLAGWAGSNVDAFGLRSTVDEARETINGVRANVIKALNIRKATGQSLTAPLTPAEIGENSQTGLNFLREVFAPAGTLEVVFKNYYERYQANPSADMELLDPGQLRDVAMHLMSKYAIINDSGKGEGLKGRGAQGVWKSAIFRFTSYPIFLTRMVDQIQRKDIRDANVRMEIIHTAGAIALIATLTIIAGANLAGTQWLREITSGKVPSTPTITSLAADGTAVGAAKAFILGGASLFLPMGGDYISSAITGQQGKDPTDMTALIPGVGAIAQVGKMVRAISQTGDLFYPLMAFVKSQSPQMEWGINRTIGAADMDALNTSRAYRSAAPSDIETRQPAGGSVKMTPTTPDVRDALRAAAVDDRPAFDAAVNRVVERARAGGLDPEAARKSFLRTLQSKSPERSVFGKTLTDEERGRVLSRMTGSQQQAVANYGAIENRINSWTGAKPKGSKAAKKTGYLKPLKSKSLLGGKTKKLLPKLA